MNSTTEEHICGIKGKPCSRCPVVRMKIIENSIGWEDEYGNQIALKEEFSFLNCMRAEKYKTPIMKRIKAVLS